jgi:hypothetical protein
MSPTSIPGWINTRFPEERIIPSYLTPPDNRKMRIGRLSNFKEVLHLFRIFIERENSLRQGFAATIQNDCLIAVIFLPSCRLKSSAQCSVFHSSSCYGVS